MATTLISGPDLTVEDFADHGGPELNMGKNYSVQWTWKLENGTYATAFCVYFVQARRVDLGEEVLVHELEENLEFHGEDVKFYVNDLTQTWTHTTEDPFSVVGPVNYEYGEGSLMFYDTLEGAEMVALSMAKSEQDFMYTPENF